LIQENSKEREFHLILGASLFFYSALAVAIHSFSFHLVRQSPRHEPARKITMLITPKPVPPPPPVEKPKPEFKKPLVKITPKKAEPPKVKQEPPPGPSPEELERQRAEALAQQKAREIERNKKIAESKFSSLFGSGTDDVLQDKSLNVLSTQNPHAPSAPKGVSNGTQSGNVQVAIKNQDVDQILNGIPTGQSRNGSGILGEHSAKQFGGGGSGNGYASVRTPEEFDRSFRMYEGRLTSYYDKTLQVEPELKGSMTIKITIAPDGHVLSCEILSSTLFDKKFEHEIAQMIQDQFHFTQIASGNEFYPKTINFHREK